MCVLIKNKFLYTKQFFAASTTHTVTRMPTQSVLFYKQNNLGVVTDVYIDTGVADDAICGSSTSRLCSYSLKTPY